MHLLGCGRFWLWAIAGALVTFSFVAAASIGLLILPFAALATVFIARSTRDRAEPLGSLVGAASICFLIAWLQRAPGGFDARPWVRRGHLPRRGRHRRLRAPHTPGRASGVAAQVG
jgi:hypothetical protein